MLIQLKQKDTFII